MDPTIPILQPAATPPSDLEQRYRQLRNLIHCLAISLIILTGTLFVFIMREIVMVRAMTKRSAVYIQEFRESNLPAVIQQLQKELVDFAQKNPDFRPVLGKYLQPRPAGPGEGVTNTSKALPATPTQPTTR